MQFLFHMVAPTHCVWDPLKIPVLICPASSPSPAAPSGKNIDRWWQLMKRQRSFRRSIQPANQPWASLPSALFWHHWPAKGASSMKTNMGPCIFCPCMIMFLSLLGHISRKSWGGTAISKVWGHKATCNPANPTSWRYVQHTWMSSGVFVQHKKWWKMLQNQIKPTNYFTGIISGIRVAWYKVLFNLVVSCLI